MNLEAIKAAIAWFENQRDGYDDARKRAIANGAMSSTIKSAEIIMTSIDTALAALREAAERREGCEFCNEAHIEHDFMNGVQTFSKGAFLVLETTEWNDYYDCYNDVRIAVQYCPKCGRKLERSDA